jgi:LuxR family maltose regulon positive regulatory protein
MTVTRASADERVKSSAATPRDDNRALDAPVLPSTFVPAGLPEESIRRPRLVSRLADGVREKPLTTLSAPAGAGKTVLAASWAAAPDVPWPVAWLTIDDALHEPDQFWRCLLESLHHAGVVLPHMRSPSLGDEVPGPFFVRLAADILDQPEPAVLIIDGADHLTGRETAGLDFLLRHAVPRFRLVLLGRADPQLPLHRYRLTDTILDIRQDSLAFTVAETQELFAHLGLRVSRDCAASLTEKTEGWAGGLRLAALSLQQGTDPDRLSASLARTDSGVAEYLLAEVLDTQPAAIRQFLLRASVPAQLTPDLLDELTAQLDSRRALAAVVHANLFVERSTQVPDLYRMHSLFRDLLKAQLHYESPAEFMELNRRCARWFAAAGQDLAALEHAVCGRDWEYAGSLLIDGLTVGSLLAHDETPYMAIVEAIPTHVSDLNATVLRVAAAISRADQIAPADMGRLIRIVADTGVPTALRISAATAVAASASVRKVGRGEAATASETTLALLTQLPPGSRPGQSAVTAVALCCRAAGLRWQQDDNAAARALIAAISACDAANSGRLKRSCLGDLALLDALRGRLESGRELAEAAEALADDCRLTWRRRPARAALALAWVHGEQFRYADARRWATRAEAAMTDADAPVVRPLLAVLRARLLRYRHGFDPAWQLLQQVAADPDCPSWVRERTLLEQADWHLAQDHFNEAVAALDALPDPTTVRADQYRRRVIGRRAPHQCDPSGIATDDTIPLDARVEAWISRACAHLGRGETTGAVWAIRQAMQLAEPEQMRRPFLSSTPELRRLLRMEPRLSTAAAWLTQPTPRPPRLAQPARGDPSTAQPGASIVTVQPLSAREIEVLRLISQQLSTEEIGAAMFVSVNTVRTHVRSILRKLAVSRRNEAVRRARQLAIV